MRHLLRLAVVWCIALAWIPHAVATPVELTQEERAWIAAHPVVRIAADPRWMPIEYVENGQHKGLIAEYLKVIGHRTGLRFEVVHGAGWGSGADRLRRGEVDVLPAALRGFTTPEVAELVEFTPPYFVGSTVVITRDDMPTVYDLAQLEGKVLALKENGAYEAEVRAWHPGIELLTTRTAEEALAAVAAGRADAAMGANVTMLPFLRRKYQGLLHQSGVIGSLPVELAMGVHRDKPVLRAILTKGLASLSPKETDAIIDLYFRKADYGAPSLSTLSRHYALQLILLALAVSLITLFAAHAHKQHKRARRSEKEKSTFLAVMSHEIRSPMNAIMGAIELLRRADLPHETRRLLDAAAGGADNLLHLLDDVLDVSKLEAGRLQLDPCPVDVGEMVRAVTDLLSVTANAKGITLEVLEQRLPEGRLMLDRSRVGQILHNLIGNAIKFTHHGGVTLKVHYESDARSTQSGILGLCVSDTGIGMDTASRQRVFDPYTQATTSTARQFGGTGLGLWICRQLVEEMGGSIELKSEPGEGTIVDVRLPATLHTSKERGDCGSRAASDLSNASTSSPRVLLTEDTEANQVVLMAQLSSLGCETALARDGTTALRALATGSYDLILMDCDLPDMSGYEVVRQWRAEEVQKGKSPTPVLAISATTGGEHISRCFDAGMDGVLTKPIKLGMLKDALQLWCDRESSQAVASDGRVTGHEILIDRQELAETMRGDISGIMTASLHGDNKAALHYAHRLVGASDVLGLTKLANDARVLEQRLRMTEEEAVEISKAELDMLETSLLEWSNEPGPIVTHNDTSGHMSPRS